MKFTLSNDDYIELHRYLIKHDPKTSHGFTSRRVIWTSIFAACLLGIATFAGSAIVAIVTIILVFPVWFLTKWLLLQYYAAKTEKSVKSNKAYTAETEIQINDDDLIITKVGVEIKIPLSIITDVMVDAQLIYIKAPDGYRIVPMSAFASEAEKGAFLDKLKQEA